MRDSDSLYGRDGPRAEVGIKLIEHLLAGLALESNQDVTSAYAAWRTARRECLVVRGLVLCGTAHRRGRDHCKDDGNESETRSTHIRGSTVDLLPLILGGSLLTSTRRFAAFS